MVLHGKESVFDAFYTLDSTVKQIDAGDFQACARYACRIDRIAVVLACDFDFTRFKVLTGWLPPRCPNFSLKVFAP